MYEKKWRRRREWGRYKRKDVGGGTSGLPPRRRLTRKKNCGGDAQKKLSGAMPESVGSGLDRRARPGRK